MIEIHYGANIHGASDQIYEYPNLTAVLNDMGIDPNRVKKVNGFYDDGTKIGTQATIVLIKAYRNVRKNGGFAKCCGIA